MECKIPVDANDDNEDEDESDNEKQKDTEDSGEVPMRPRINIDGKDKNTLTALHHAAKRGFTVKLFFYNMVFFQFHTSFVFVY